MTDDTQWLDPLAEVARVAGAVALRRFRTRAKVEWKNDGSPVTAADREAEHAARDWLATRFPDDAVLGEEFGATGPGGGRRWLIDPIDGTRTFVAGVPLWGTLVAVLEGDDVIAGAINCAALGELAVAARGAGAWLNGTRIQVSGTDRIEEAVLLTTDERFSGQAARRRRWADLAGRAALVRSWGDCYGYLLLASGRADAMVDGRMQPWDAAALFPIVAEAGGVITDWRGRSTPFGGDIIATNAALADSVRAALAGED